LNNIKQIRHTCFGGGSWKQGEQKLFETCDYEEFGNANIEIKERKYSAEEKANKMWTGVRKAS
jgi:hypothetical protein